LGIRAKKSRVNALLKDDSVLLSETHIEDPLEALLDEQSDEEFGDLVLRDAKRKATGQKVKLAEWTAKDFSSIYIRFRPHLERHARRFLSDPSRVDEVVQDAFLYLMVSLPELDSEIGVLRFLKWKTRLLALDVIKASGRAYINSIEDVPEPESEDPEVSSHLEQQDDAAVVKLALSKLNPRHREVLIASMYEEKSTEQIASQVGLSENATRQLIFRARAAFKKALIGDVDTSGMSAAAILSVAARKAAAEGKKVGAAALTLIALAVMSLSVWPSLNRNQDNIAGPVIEPSESASSVPSDPNETSPAEDSGAGLPTSTPLTPENAKDILNDADNIQPIFTVGETPGTVLQIGESYSVSADAGVTATFDFNNALEESKFSNIKFSFEISDVVFTVRTTALREIYFQGSATSNHFVLVAELRPPSNLDEQIWNDSPLATSLARIELVKDQATGDLVSVTLSITPAD
jgi:RNA polymerase sigma-70 factor (ECF subfamily)